MIGLSKSFTLTNLSSQLFHIEKMFARQFIISSINKSNANVSEENNKVDEELEEELQAKEEYIKKQQNKSKLLPQDYNRQHDRMPYDECRTDAYLRHKRRLYGKFGEETKVNPSILWPSYEEMRAMKEYESVAQPYTFQELLHNAKEKKRLEEEAKEAEKAAILAKVKNVKKEILEFHKRVRQKNEEAMKIAERKNKMIEEVKKHFGYNIKTTDPKFIEMLSEFEKKQRKAAKIEKTEARKKAITEKLNNKDKKGSTSSSEENEEKE